MAYLKDKYPYKTTEVYDLFDIIGVDEFADYIKDKYPKLKINSYEITVYNIMKIEE